MMPYFDTIMGILDKKETTWRNLSDESDCEDADLADAASAAFFKIKKYFDVLSELGAVGTVLDPRFKMEYFLGSAREKGARYTEVLEIFTYEHSLAPADVPSQGARRPLRNPGQTPCSKSPLGRVSEMNSWTRPGHASQNVLHSIPMPCC
jgi:hypothetical protein